MPQSKKEKKLSDKEAYVKISSWCAYQERSHQEVRRKLYEFGIKTDIIDEIIFQLISENFLNEERFSKAFAGGKFRMKRWGKVRIKEALKQKGVSENCIKAGLEVINEEEYFQTISDLIEKKQKELKSEPNQFIKKRKIATYIIQKGFEPDLVWEILRKG